MATVYKILGQSNPAKDTETTLYTVPASTSAIVSTIVATNISVQGNSLTGLWSTVSIIVRPAADSTTQNKHYITYKALVQPGQRLTMTVGITLSAGDKILVNCSNINFAISLFGSEIS